ncbi:MAG: chorismate-binding protein [Streptomycetaceae bacterium]|nr:chorismate-binding protein [Streptomycetaceae bacterium]
MAIAESACSHEASSVISRLMDSGEPFAVLHRRAPYLSPDTVEILLGPVGHYATLAELPMCEGATGRRENDLLALVPYQQIRERGFQAREDGTPLRALRVRESYTFSLQDVVKALPNLPVRLDDSGFTVGDDEYAAIVKQVISEEIGRGEGANFVIRRDFVGTFADFSPALALSLLRRLLDRERGAYWTFLAHTGDCVLIGASPEAHVRQDAGTVVMNPISGTYRYPANGPTHESLLNFLGDAKEREELSMVVDEELKMMCAVGDLGGQVLGPRLKEMSHLAHTEYELRGRTTLDVREVLRRTMFAPTVTGSPLQNATRVIRRYEPTGRGYYSGALALIGRTAEGAQSLDSPILIRAANIDPATGRLTVGVGATLVRHSDPFAEVAETHAKSAGILTALGALPPRPDTTDRPRAETRLSDDQRVQAALASRRSGLAPFWLRMQTDHPALPADAPHILVVDCEDDFTTMLAHLLRSLGNRVTVLPYSVPDMAARVTAHRGPLVLGPGPGDPQDTDDPKMCAMRELVERLLADARGELLAVCLSHQLVCAALGLPLGRKELPYQGAQERIDLFGRQRTVGFYNTFAAYCSDADARNLAARGIQVSRDPSSGEVYALRGPGFATLQFHPESVLTVEGIDILAEALAAVAPARTI